MPVYTTKGPAPEKIVSVIACGCNKGCGKICKCVQTNLLCTTMCNNCRGQSCSNSETIDISDEEKDEGNFPYFLWQEYKENFELLSSNRITALNKATSKGQKTLTLPADGRRNHAKDKFNFDKMIIKHHNGDEKPMRCLIWNNKEYAAWTYDANGKHISFPPLVAYFLEVIFLKQVQKLSFYFKDDYEVDFQQNLIKNQRTGLTMVIFRETIDFIHPRWNKSQMLEFVNNINATESLMKRVSEYDIDRIKNILFATSITAAEVSRDTLNLNSNQWISILVTDTSQEASLTIDPFCFEKHCATLVSENGTKFSANLIFTDLEENINKFFILQLLKSTNRNKYFIWTRSGRIGCDSPGECSKYYSRLEDAKKEFKKIFMEKTQNSFSQRSIFRKKENHYDLMDAYFIAENDMELHFEDKLNNTISTMDEKYQDILSLIVGNTDSNLNKFVKNWLLKYISTEIGIPTKKQLAKAFNAFNEVADLLHNKDTGRKLVEACNKYYMKMPHNTKKHSPKVIINAEAFEDEVVLLQTLAYAAVTEREKVENPVDLYFRKFQWTLTYLDHDGEKFIILRKALIDLHGLTHKYKMHLLDAYEWAKKAEEERFLDRGKRMLLWHGTQLSNMLGIIKNGLQLPPDDVRTFSMFGRGLYFSDVSSKSANYCLATKKNNVVLLLLCEVSMGTAIQVHHPGDYSSKPDAFGGVEAAGKYYPSNFTESILEPNAILPKGPLAKRDIEDLSLLYNEYVIYDERQVKIRYLLKIKISK